MPPSDMKHLTWEMRDNVAVATLDRPHKRNAINDALLADLEAFFSDPPQGAGAVVLRGAGDHFSAGLDLAEHKERDAFAVMHHSQLWHRVFHGIQFGGLPVVAALHGGVIGGGLELALATHVRVSEPGSFYSLPEGQRGIFVGGGASVRVARLIGTDRMVEMMLTGRRFDAEEGLRLGFAHYLVGKGEGLDKALELAAMVAGNAPMSNYMMLNAVSHIGDMSMGDGLFTESLATALTQTSADAAEGLEAFLEGRKASFDKEK